MPPWNSMSPQQQLQVLQMMRAQFGGGGVVPGMGAPPGVAPGMGSMNPAMQSGMMPGATMANNPLLNGQAGQMNPAMNSQLMQYLMALRGQPGGLGALQQPTMAQMLSPQGGNTWGLGL